MPPDVYKYALSIIVISCDRKEELLLTIADLASQKGIESYEIIIVLQRYSDDGAREVEEALKSIETTKCLRYAEGLGVYGARNAGVSVAEGEIIAFVDDDCRIPREWAASILEPYANSSVGGVGGFVDHELRQALITKLIYRAAGVDAEGYKVDSLGFHSAPMFKIPRDDHAAEWLSGCNMSFRRRAMESAGEFVSAYGNYGFDDLDYSLRIRSLGWSLVARSAASVRHYPSRRGRQLRYKQAYQEERRRARLSSCFFGSHRFWAVRYLARGCRLCVLHGAVSVKRRDPRIVVAAIAGMIRGVVEA